MRKRDEMNEGPQQGGDFKERLRDVRKRKKNRRRGDRVAAGTQPTAPLDPFACSVVASKLRLVEARRGRDDGRTRGRRG